MNDNIAALYQSHHEQMQQRFASALQAAGFDAVIVYSGQAHTLFQDDNHCPFRANPHFKTWLPLPDHQGGAVVANAGDKPGLVFLQPEDYWHTPPADPEGYWPDLFNLNTAKNEAEVTAQLAGLSGRLAIIADHTLPTGISELGELNPEQLLHQLNYDRVEKTAYEVECMRRANAIAARGHRAAEKAFRAGASEFEIHIEYCRACGQTSDQLPYNNIVALNGHGAVLHYCEYEHVKEAPRAFLIDAGASYNGYAADITRTYSAADDDFAALIQSVDRAQQSLCDESCAGIDYVELHLLAHHKLADVLIEHDVISCSADAAVASGISTTFYPHGLGHYIGTQVHDVAGHQASADGQMNPPPSDHPFLRLTGELTPGTVCTIEPGIYFIEMLLEKLRQTPASADVNWDRVRQLMPFGGARVEDDIHITDTSHENLTRTHL